MEAHEPRQLHQSHDRPVQGMERVVATVSGYCGSERFNLIKLITHAGANYVGAMSKSITHLVCWKFEGKKYEIAQKFNIITVNHRWIEDCIKEGRHVPVASYIQQSGYEVGPLLLELPLTVQASSLTKNKVISDRLDDICSGKQKIEFSSRAPGNSVWEDCCMIYKQEGSSPYSSRQSRKVKRKICDGNGVSTVAEPHCTRRVVKNIVDEVMHDPLFFDLSQEDHLNRWDSLHNDAAATSCLSGGGANNESILENREASYAGVYNHRETINEASDTIDQIGNSKNISTSVEDPLLVVQTSIDACSSIENFTDGNQDDKVAGLPTYRELSCVICFEDFSATRGILQCGHRFCYSCIREWVDHRTSTRKRSTCPLCKASFVVIKKVEHAAATDQKIYSQTIPCDDSAQDIFIVPEPELPDYCFERMQNTEASACVVCRGLEPEDLLQRCAFCRTRRIHSYCMDPPVEPWTCNHCNELQRLHRIHSY